MSRILIVGETGSTHDGYLPNMRLLIHAAAKAGVDVCKFQWVSSAEELCERRHAQEYLDAYQRIQFPREWLEALKVACDLAGIEFGCTVYLPQDVDVIAPFVTRFKVSSFEAGAPDLIAAMRKHDKPIMVSYGMAQPIHTGTVPLHCISSYPAPLKDLNLNILHSGAYSGYSDHSGQTFTGALAVAAGARILETHFRLDDCDPVNPDFPHSLTPDEIAEYVRLARLADVCMGSGIKRVQASEEPFEAYCVR